MYFSIESIHVTDLTTPYVLALKIVHPPFSSSTTPQGSRKLLLLLQDYNFTNTIIKKDYITKRMKLPDKKNAIVIYNGVEFQRLR